MGNTPSAQHGSPSRPSHGHGHGHGHASIPQTAQPSNPQPGPGPTNPNPNPGIAVTNANANANANASASNSTTAFPAQIPSSSGGTGTGTATSSSRHPNLRLPMPSRPTHISPQSSNPTSPSGSGHRGGSPRRRKSLELPDLNKLSFTPAAPVPTTATTTNHHLAVSTPPSKRSSHSPGSGNDAITPSSAPPVPASAPGASSRKWQHLLGTRASPLAGANSLGAMSKLASPSPSTSNVEPRSAPVRIPDPAVASISASSSPAKPALGDTINPYFPASPTRQSKATAAIPIPGKAEKEKEVLKDGVIPPPSTRPASPPSRDDRDRDRAPGAADDGKVNVPVQWVGGGKVVYVTGNFAENWRGRIKLKRSTHDFNTVLRLPPGQYRLKFIVDDSWRCSKQIPTATDDDGTLVNWIEVEPAKTEEELKAEWAMDSKPAVKQEDDDDSQWTNVIPAPLVAYQYIEELPLTMEPGDFDTYLRSTPYLSSVPQPPTLPRILDKVIVNAEPKRKWDDLPAAAGQSPGGAAHPHGQGQTPAGLDDNSILAVPNHVVLNHLTASAIKNGTLGVGTTTRYRKKYITTMFFKPSSNDLNGEGQQAPDGPPA